MKRKMYMGIFILFSLSLLITVFSGCGSENDGGPPFSADALDPPTIVDADEFTIGTYKGKTDPEDTELTTYIFGDGGSCTRSGPDPYGYGQTVVTTGTWGYTDGELTIETSGTVLFISVTIIEIYNPTFITNSKLTFRNFYKTNSDLDTVVGTYKEGSGSSVQITANSDTTTIISDTTVSVNTNGTWNASGIITTTVNSGTPTRENMDPESGSWNADDNILVKYNGSYYLPPVYDDIVFTKQ
ncbi:MAG: hypothetical protein GY754_30185 [bacterium]|nr:hypothetical protein [bacterium]